MNRPSRPLVLISVLAATVGVAALAFAQNPPAYVTSWGQNGSGDGQFIIPFGLAVAPNGDVYVADYGNNRIQVFDANGVFELKWGTPGTLDGQMSTPNGVAVDLGGNVYVTDTGNNRIQKFSATGTFVTKWGTMVCMSTSSLIDHSASSMLGAMSSNGCETRLCASPSTIMRPATMMTTP